MECTTEGLGVHGVAKEAVRSLYAVLQEVPVLRAKNWTQKRDRDREGT